MSKPVLVQVLIMFNPATSSTKKDGQTQTKAREQDRGAIKHEQSADRDQRAIVKGQQAKSRAGEHKRGVGSTNEHRGVSSQYGLG